MIAYVLSVFGLVNFSHEGFLAGFNEAIAMRAIAMRAIAVRAMIVICRLFILRRWMRRGVGDMHPAPAYAFRGILSRCIRQWLHWLEHYSHYRKPA